jgi:hypothetical protein
MLCDCDTTGTYLNSSSCDLETGQCDCLADREGKKCNECTKGKWGSPTSECKGSTILFYSSYEKLEIILINIWIK